MQALHEHFGVVNADKGDDNDDNANGDGKDGDKQIWKGLMSPCYWRCAKELENCLDHLEPDRTSPKPMVPKEIGLVYGFRSGTVHSPTQNELVILYIYLNLNF